ncbi:hypothetical protein NC652_015616 [Populus alba x Populus x berolinensis]|nr:hypothetical protein NC652_015616 [Populus alba x Populus x berolinensis]
MGAEDVVGTYAWFLYGSFWEVKVAMFRLHPNKAHLEESGNEEREEVEAHEGYIHVHAHATHGHSHGSGDSSGSSLSQLILHPVLELRIVVHSVITGISLRASASP